MTEEDNFGKCGRPACRAVSGQVNHGYCPECKDKEKTQ